MTQTRRGAVAVLIGAGMVAALQIGKAAIAMPLLQDGLGLSLVFAAWIVGAYGLLGAVLGLPAGAAASLFSPRRALIAGLALAGIASLTGGFAGGGIALLVTRVMEGLGFLAIVISVPRLLRLVTAPGDVAFVMALWGSYMPAGSAAMMLAGPALAHAGGWEALWLVNGAVALACAALIAGMRLPEPEAQAAPMSRIATAARALIASPGLFLLAAMFGVYTFQYAALAGLMPTLLIQRGGLSIAEAGLASAAAVVANAAGNLSAGLLVRQGVPFWLIALAAIGSVGALSVGIFSAGLPAAGVAALAALSLGITGLIPASIFSVTPRFASSPALLALSLGLLIQTSNIGNLLGPAALGAFVERYGWTNAPLVFFAVTAAGIAIALCLRIALRRAPTSP